MNPLPQSPPIVEITPWTTSLEYVSKGIGAHDAFSFAIIADAHCVETSASVRHGHGLEHLGDGTRKLSRCFDAIRELNEDEQPSFLVLLGDIGIEAAERVLADAPCPIHAVAGNHDWGTRRERLRHLFPDDFGTGLHASDYYTVEHASVQFIFICNAGTGNEHTGQLSSEDIRPPGQPAWLRKRLGCTTELPKVLLGHCPPQPPGFEAGAYLEQATHGYLPYMGDCDSELLNQLLFSAGPVAAFFGHLHRATYSYLTGASRVHVLRSSNWNHDDAPVGFTQVRISDGSIKYREVLTGTYQRRHR